MSKGRANDYSQSQVTSKMPLFKLGSKNVNVGAALKNFLRSLKIEFGEIIDNVENNQEYQRRPLPKVGPALVATSENLDPDLERLLEERLAEVGADDSQGELSDNASIFMEIHRGVVKEQQERFNDIREPLVKERDAFIQAEVRRMTRYLDDCPKICSRILDQLDTELKVAVESDESYSAAANDPLNLWILVKKFTMTDDVIVTNKPRLARDAMLHFEAFRQAKGQPLADFYEAFQYEVQRCEAAGGGFVSEALVLTVPSVDADGDPRSMAERRAIAVQEYLAQVFCDKVLDAQYGGIINQWRTDLANGHDDFPKTVKEAFNKLRAQREILLRPERAGNPGAHVAFAAKSTIVADDSEYAEASVEPLGRDDDDGNDLVAKVTRIALAAVGAKRSRSEPQAKVKPHHEEEADDADSDDQESAPPRFKERPRRMGMPNGMPHGNCHYCGKRGHFKRDCPQLKREFLKWIRNKKAVKNANYSQDLYHLSLAETSVNELIDNRDILCDNQSTVNVFSNKSLLTNLRTIPEGVTITGVGGSIWTNTVGDHYLFGTVYYHPEGVANILSFADMRERYQVTFNPDGNYFRVNVTPRSAIYFHCEGKLYKYRDRREVVNVINTVSDNMRQFTKQEVHGAEAARELFIRMGRPSEKDFLRMITKIRDCGVTPRDVRNANVIFGKDLGAVKGRTTRHKPPRTEVPTISARDHEYRKLVLCVDVMEIEGVKMLVSISRRLKLTMTRYLATKSKEDVANAVLEMINEYTRHGFEVTTILSDSANEFISAGVSVATHRVRWNTATKSQHVPEIERNIRLIKERCRAIMTTLPFKTPQVMIEHLVNHVTMMINMTPREGEEISPRQAVLGIVPSVKNDYAISFGAYVQVPEDEDTLTNSMRSRTYGAVCLGHAGKLQKTYNFLSLKTWKVVQRSHWTELPMPDEVVTALNEKAASDQARRHRTDPTPAPGTAQQADDPPIVNQDLPMLPPPAPGEVADPGGEQLPPPVADEIADIDPQDEETVLEAANRYMAQHVAATNLSVPKALKTHGSEAMMSLFNEAGQMVTKEVFHPVKWEGLSQRQRRHVLRSLMFVKMKRDGKLKSRFCVDGRPQKVYGVNMDPSSPTAGTQSIFMSALIDAHERRYVKIVDIEGAYLKVPINEDVYVQIDDTLSAIFVNVVPEWTEYLRGDQKLVVKLDKALYGTVQAARLFYEHVANTLTRLGFKANQYDKCVFNKTYEGKQCTVVVYVDDLKISCANAWVVNKVVADLREAYETLTVKEGTSFDYLGMDLNYGTPGKVTVTMTESEAEAIAEYPEEADKTCATPASNLLFDQRKAKPLSSKEAEKFHSVVAKLLYIAKRSRPDILTAVSFLTTRVAAPDEEDERKLRRILRYLSSTKGKGICLHTPDLTTIHAYVDAAYGTYKDFIGVTGAVISVGQATVYTQSSKQKLVAKSSTEAEVVGVAEALSFALWIRNFMVDQGYDMKPIVLYQDNQSAIWMENSGYRASKRTRHMNIKYFHVCDRIKLGEVIVKYLSTNDMVADLMTKPLQGAKFVRFRDMITGKVQLPLDSLRGCVEEGDVNVNGNVNGNANGNVNSVNGTTRLELGPGLGSGWTNTSLDGKFGRCTFFMAGNPYIQQTMKPKMYLTQPGHGTPRSRVFPETRNFLNFSGFPSTRPGIPNKRVFSRDTLGKRVSDPSTH